MSVQMKASCNCKIHFNLYTLMKESREGSDGFVLDLQLMQTTWEMLFIYKCIVP